MDDEKTVTELLKIIKVLSEQDMGELSGDTLSRLVMKIASYKARLGTLVSEAKRLAWDAEAEYYRVRAEAYKVLRDGGKGSTDADELKRLEAHDSFVALNQAKYNTERISQLSMDCHDLIESIRGRLIDLHRERGESNAF